jgi:predicted Rossmann fold nucleotide-binding protein DprA/Smf involved in DNA uptake
MVSDYYSTNVRAIELNMPLFAAARKSDPATSHSAAARVKEFRSHQHAVILEALAAGPAGASGIAARCGLLPHQIGKRIAELAKAGRIVETGRTVTSSSGRGEREWRAT